MPRSLGWTSTVAFAPLCVLISSACGSADGTHSKRLAVRPEPQPLVTAVKLEEASKDVGRKEASRLTQDAAGLEQVGHAADWVTAVDAGSEQEPLHGYSEYSFGALGDTAAVRASGGLLTVAGTLSVEEGEWDHVRRVAYRYDPELDRFLALPDLAQPAPRPSMLHLFPVAERGLVLIDDELGRSTRAHFYDAVAGSWTTREAPVGYLTEGAVQLGDGRVFVHLTDAAAIFDPLTKSWTETSPPLGDSVAGALALLPDGSVLVSQGVSPEVSRYFPAEDRWEKAGRLAQPRPEAVMLSVDGGALLLGGRAGEPGERRSLTSTEVYDIATGRWSKGPRMPASQTRPAAVPSKPGVLTFGGLSLPCATVRSCGGRDVTALSGDGTGQRFLPDLPIQMPRPAVVPLGEEYLVFGSQGYLLYSAEVGSRAP